MSELITKNPRPDTRLQLLASVSAVSLLIVAASPACAEETDRPTVWIELGGQFSRIEDGQEVFAPEVMDGRPSIFAPSQKFEKQPGSAFEETGAISIQPEKSGWVYSAAVRYGRAKSTKHVQQQTSAQPFEKYGPDGTPAGIPPIYPIAQKFAETNVRNSEQHLVLDFAVGKDVGLGLFGGRDSTSVISAGVRFAQFTDRTNIALKSDPDWQFKTKYLTAVHLPITNGQPFHSNLGALRAERSFHGIGPSLSWKASETLAGGNRDGAIALDWGLNAAILFGRQKAHTHHQTTQRSFPDNGPIGGRPIVLQTVTKLPATPDHTRSRSVTIPNIGAFAGLSYRYDTAKLSFGYRADFFFGAMDGGIDARKTYDRNFYGPFATVSIGLGG
jgi:hypothetical protein